MKGDVIVRPMRPEDWPAVCEIYAQGRDSTFETEPPAWEDWDAAHLAGCRLVAVEGATVMGWAALVSVSHREVYRSREPSLAAPSAPP